jgi:hypothetical protein
MCAMRTLLSPPSNLYNRAMSRASSLYRLQELDLEIGRAEARIAEIEAALADDEELRAAKKRAGDLEEELSGPRSQFKRRARGRLAAGEDPQLRKSPLRGIGYKP